MANWCRVLPNCKPSLRAKQSSLPGIDYQAIEKPRHFYAQFFKGIFYL
jgi:hypothetical protein